ncbi:MAG: DegV family EDD domain-containing protein [Candidatus Heimdallarchaeota archaeon]|nr:DegV family EDD domain-containing protein [Candidatus Heimdallarchaeota archaeon]
MKTRFVVDSASDIPWDYAKKNNIEVIPLKVTYYDQTYEENEDFDLQEYYHYFQTDNKFLPKTSQPSPQEFLKVFLKLIKEGVEEIIVVTISSNLSGTFNSARLAQRNLKGLHPEIEVQLVDSLNASYSEVLLAERGLDLADEGLSGEQIAEKLADHVSQIKTHLYLPTLKYLHLGGRINIAQYYLARLLGKKALVRVNKQGKNESFGTVNDEEEGLKRVIKASTEDFSRIPEKAAIVHTNSPSLAKKLKKMVQEKIPSLKDLRIILSRTSISAHTGPASIALIVDHGEE